MKQMDKKDGMSKTVTVVIPIYNVEKYLNRCIESVAGQTYKNLEIILVDDESPDNCPRICEDWKNRDNRIKVMRAIGWKLRSDSTMKLRTCWKNCIKSRWGSMKYLHEIGETDLWQE